MTNSWAMLYDSLYGEYIDDRDADSNDDYIVFGAAEPVYLGGMVSSISDDYINLSTSPAVETTKDVVITEEIKVTSKNKDVTFWKYDEGKILREVEAYLSSTYKGHYVGEESKVQTLDLIDSIGDAEAFCRSNAIKYLSRFGKKDGKNPKDLLKVIHYAILLYHFSELPFTEDAKETFSATGR